MLVEQEKGSEAFNWFYDAAETKGDSYAIMKVGRLTYSITYRDTKL